MQLHSSKIISSFYYILQSIGQTSKTFRTWICMNSGQLEDFSKIHINLLEKFVLLPSAFLKSFTSNLFMNIFPVSLLLFIFILNRQHDSVILFGIFQRQDQPGASDICPDRYASKALSWLFLLNREDFDNNSPRVSEIWKHLYKSGFMVISP